MALKKINYNGSSKVILRLCEMVNQLIDGGGGGGSTVTYTQTLSSGTKTGSISIDGVSTDMYAPTPPTNVSDLTNDAGYLTSSDVSAVAMSGSYSDLSNKPTLGTAAAENVGVANGVAELDANGKVPSSQLPSYVDDVIEGYYDSVTDRFYEESTFTTVIPPESSKSWVDIPSNKSYRWTGSVYTRVDEGVQLGETSSTAYRGDRGKTAYDHSQSDHSTITPAFTEASTRANIATGENIATIFGKIKKYFTDLKAVAFSGSYSDLSDTPTIPTKVSDLQNDSGFITGLDIEDIGDVILTNLANGQVLKYNSSTRKWENANESGGGATYTAGDGINISAQNAISVNTAFSEASTRTNIASGDTFATILGKIKKFFTDLKDLAFIAKDGISSTKYLRGDGTWQEFPSIPSAVAVKGNNENSYRTGNVNLTADNIGALVNYGNLRNTIGQNTPATATKNFYDGTVATQTIGLKGAYNNAGEEYSLLFGNGGASYGSVLKWGYANKYIYILRKNQSIWQSTDWEKIYAGYADEADHANTADSATDSTKLPLAGGTMTGTINCPNNTLPAIRYRYGGTWNTYSVYETAGNEALVHATQKSETSFIFVNGEAESNIANNRWQSLTPALQIKKNCVVIGKLIANNVDPTFKFEVYGSIGFTDMTSTDIRGATTNQILYVKSDGTVGKTSRSLLADYLLSDNPSVRSRLKFYSEGNYAGYMEAQSDTLCICEDRVNGLLLRATTGVYVRPRTGLTFSPVAASAFNVNSSRRYKENIKPLSEEEAKKILDIETVTFDYKNKENANERNVYNQRGVIAEQVEKIIPYAVTLEKVKEEEVPGYVDYSKFVPYLIKMVQLQQKQIDNLMAEISALKQS